MTWHEKQGIWLAICPVSHARSCSHLMHAGLQISLRHEDFIIGNSMQLTD